MASRLACRSRKKRGARFHVVFTDPLRYREFPRSSVESVSSSLIAFWTFLVLLVVKEEDPVYQEKAPDTKCEASKSRSRPLRRLWCVCTS
jgi:hypothetical protein